MSVNNLSKQHIRDFFPLNHLSDARLDELLKYCQRYYLRQGKILFEPGMSNTDAFFILSGEIQVSSKRENITTDFHYPLYYEYSNQDVVIAAEDCSLLKIDREYLDKLLSWAQVAKNMELSLVSQRNPNDESVDWMQAVLNSNLFYKVPPINIGKVFDQLYPLKVEKGQKIIEQGDVGDGCYFIKEGSATVTRVMEKGSEPVTLAEIGFGRCFGEDALVQATVRNATVSMSSDGLLMKMEKTNFLQLLREPMVETIGSIAIVEAVEKGAVLLDVRTQEEYEYEHLKNSLYMPLEFLVLKEYSLDKKCDYIVVCDTGRRSRSAAFLLKEKGYSAKSLTGGIINLAPDKRESLLDKSNNTDMLRRLVSC